MNDGAKRQFDRSLVDAFAAYAGDRNPIHVDEIEARRLLFGTCIVHGALLTLWALALVAERAGRPAIGLERLKASFKSPVAVGEQVTADIEHAGDNWTLRLRHGDRLVTRVGVTTGTPTIDRPIPSNDETSVCRTLTEDEIAGAAGSVRLSAGNAATLFPALGRLPAVQIAAVAAASRIVGMECPGRHSLFSDLTLTFPRDPENALAFRMVRWDDRFRLAELSLSGAAAGSATAFVRPPPVDQPATASLVGVLDPTLFARASVLVVGGSRGLGELLAKLFATAGASVTLTYTQGADDAAAVVADINATFPGRARAARFDVLRPDPNLLQGAYSHVFYCASPKILANRSGHWSDTDFERYQRFYSSALRQTIERLAGTVTPGATVVNLSTIYAKDPPDAFREYARAKSDSEAVCREVAERFGLTGVNWRLPRLRTDQTQSLTQETFDDPVPLLLGKLKALATDE